MPFIGLGLHVFVALFFAVHAIRSGQQLYWLIILFSFPLLGSVVYFFAIYLPHSRLDVGARKVLATAAKTLDPTRELREAQAAFDYTPTAQNRMRLALAQLETGDANAAALNYEGCLQGPFANDPHIKFLAARAFVESARFAQAITHLQDVRQGDSNYQAEPVGLLLARALAGAGRNVEAKAEFESLLQRFGSFEVKVEYAILASQTGDDATASQLQAEIDHTMQHWNKHNKQLNADLIRRLTTARKRAA
jgi:hypothetical protein